MKNAFNGESAIARIVFSGEDSDNWRKEQLEDPNVAVILLTRVPPSWQEVAARGASAKVYWSYWDSLEVKDGIFYKR